MTLITSCFTKFVISFCLVMCTEMISYICKTWAQMSNKGSLQKQRFWLLTHRDRYKMVVILHMIFANWFYSMKLTALLTKSMTFVPVVLLTIYELLNPARWRVWVSFGGLTVLRRFGVLWFICLIHTEQMHTVLYWIVQYVGRDR